MKAIPDLNPQLAKIHDFMDKHEWKQGMWPAQWIWCSTCGQIAMVVRDNKLRYPEVIIGKNIPDLSLVPLDMRKAVAKYLIDINWHKNGQVIDQERLDFLRYNLDAYGSVKTTYNKETSELGF